MKINNIILVSLIFVILTVGAVSASDNAEISDNISSPQDDVDIIADDDDDDSEEFDYTQYEEGTGKIVPDVTVDWPNEIKVGDTVPISFVIPEDMHTNVVLFINNERVDDGQEADNNESYDVFIDEFGTNTLKFKFYGDDKYAPIIKSKTYNVKDFMFTAELADEELIYGLETSVEIEFPFDATGYVTADGVKYVIGDESYLTIPLRNLKLGTNQIQIRYSGDEKYPSKTVTVSVNVHAQIQYNDALPFNNVTFTLSLPSNAAGSLEVTVDGDNVKTSKLSNGFAQVKFSGLALGTHTVKTKYTGNDYSCVDEGEKSFEVYPDIVVNSFRTTKDENTVKINLPEGESGKLDVKVKRILDWEVGGLVSEQSKTADVVDGSVISFSTFDFGLYIYDIKFTSNSGYYYSVSPEGFVRDEFSMNMTCPDSVLADNDFIEVSLDYIALESGTIELYVDGEFYDEFDCGGTDSAYFYIEDGLSVGNHVIKAVFLGNDRYMPLEKSATLESTYLVIYVPEEILVDNDEEIIIETIENATGSLVVYVDGTEFARQKIEDGYASVNMSSLPFGSYSVSVAYEDGNHPSVSEEAVSLNVSYTFAMEEESPAYGTGDLYVIDVPSNLPVDDLVVKVDNVTYPVIKTGNEIGINVSGLDMGSHVITVSHPGDDTFYPLSVEKTIDVAPTISVPSQTTYGEEKTMTLVLPENPEGKLVLSVYDENSQSFRDVTSFGFTQYGNNSIAEIPVSALGIGDHKVKVRYTGRDYVVADQIQEVSINLDLKFDSEIQYSKTPTIAINLPNAQGSIDVYLDSDFYRAVKFTNGVAKIEFRGLEVGQHSFELSYSGASSFEYEGMFVVYPIISVPTGTVIDAEKSITLNSGSEPVGSVTVYADGKKYKEIDLEEGKQSISLGGLSNGEHKLSIVYDSWDEMKYTKNYTVTTKKASITAKDMSMNYLDGSKFKVLIKDYKGKAVKKGQTVKFYVDGKLYKTVKTDAKGYASIVLTHAPKTHNVKVIYKATTVTKKVTVKQILTLKKVAVKKSAKNVVLTATLKKINGKYLKNKQIVFKFNGKTTYKAFTNSKGVAKVTVPQNVLKKLKVGKKVTYQATYVKATVKQTVKISK